MEPSFQTSQKRPTGCLSKVLAVILICAFCAGLWFGSSYFERHKWEPKYNALEEEKDSLEAEVSSLHSKNEQLEIEMSNLQASYDSMGKRYSDICETVNLRHGLASDKKKFVTPDDSVVAATVRTITGGFSEDVNERWADYMRMYEWVTENIDYSSDTPLPLLPSLTSPDHELSWQQDYWRMPRETLEDEEGDCEDMAVLLASMRSNYTSGKYASWVIMWASENSGHTAVAFPVEGGNLTILDPAGNYYTNEPYSLGSRDVSTAVDDWLAQWPGELGIHVAGVFSDTVYETFDTTNEFVEWALAR